MIVTDGRTGDSDGLANGVISDPGGMGFLLDSQSVTTPQVNLEQIYVISIIVAIIVFTSGVGVLTIVRKK